MLYRICKLAIYLMPSDFIFINLYYLCFCWVKFLDSGGKIGRTKMSCQSAVSAVTAGCPQIRGPRPSLSICFTLAAAESQFSKCADRTKYTTLRSRKSLEFLSTFSRRWRKDGENQGLGPRWQHRRTAGPPEHGGFGLVLYHLVNNFCTSHTVINPSILSIYPADVDSEICPCHWSFLGPRGPTWISDTSCILESGVASAQAN